MPNTKKPKTTVPTRKVSFNFPEKLLSELYVLYEKEIPNHSYSNFTFTDYIKELLIETVQKASTK